MADYDQLFEFGAQGEYINTVTEIPKGSMLKIEYDRDKKTFILDRVEPAAFTKPVNYGFIPRTLDEDGDALDTLLITEEPLPTGVVVRATVIGLLNFEDDGEKDYKVICVPEDDRNTGSSIKSLDDLPDAWKRQIEFHFNHYKDLKKPGTTIVHGWGGTEDAWRVIGECAEAFKK